MTRKKGSDLIAEFLINEKIPYVFGIRGHGNVGMLDALYDVQVDANVRPPATGTRALPPLAHAEPAFGEPFMP